MGRPRARPARAQGDETVLDAGCGSGRVTELLIDRLPHGKVIAVDSAPAMVAKAREAIGDRAEVLLQDLAELRLPSRSMPSSRTRCSTGCSTTSVSSSACSSRSSRAAGSRHSAVAPGTSRPSTTPSAGWPTAHRSRRTSRTGRARGTSPRRRGDRSGSSGSASPTSIAGSRTGRWCRPSRTSTCARSASATTSSSCRTSYATRSSAASWTRSGPAHARVRAPQHLGPEARMTRIVALPGRRHRAGDHGRRAPAARASWATSRSTSALSAARRSTSTAWR